MSGIIVLWENLWYVSVHTAATFEVLIIDVCPPAVTILDAFLMVYPSFCWYCRNANNLMID